MLFSELAKHIIQRLDPGGKTGGKVSLTPVGGGSINEAGKLILGEHSYFCKLNSATKFPQLFSREADGLMALEKTGVIRVPKVVDVMEVEEHQVLLMEWIEEGKRTTDFWTNFGKGLAALHQCRGEHFGWKEANYMGSVVQVNEPKRDWIAFFKEQRLDTLVQQCFSRRLLSSRHLDEFEKLYGRLRQIFGEDAKPVMIHGDLWSGNFLCDKQGNPVLIDPAVSYGHPSCDLAMTTLFGGFSTPFYEAYQYYHPLPPNYKEQWEVCNLYPLLIHLLLFGSGYLPSIERSLKRYQ